MRNPVTFAGVSAVLVAAAMSCAVHADFAIGNEVYIQGIAGPQNGYTYWGSNVNGQNHALGQVGQQFVDTFSNTDFVSVTSWVNSQYSVTFSFDFSQFNPGAYSLHALEIIGLKNDGSLSGVSASQGFAYVQDGNKIRWDGNGAGLQEMPKLLLTITQVPAPSAFALLGVAGLSRSRRRR